MHSIDSLLECLKITGYGHNIFVQCANLEFMVLEIALHVLLVGLRVDELFELSHIEFVPDIYHALVPPHQFLFEFHPELINTLLDLSLKFLLVEVHIRQ